MLIELLNSNCLKILFKSHVNNCVRYLRREHCLNFISTYKQSDISNHIVQYSVSSSKSEMDLKKVINKLNDFANISLAENWDNVGLLVEPSPPHVVKTIYLTNDLTAATLDEAIQKKVGLIVSYHPPIFTPLKCLTQQSWKEKLIVKCIENRIAVYSPHTSYDALQGGVNDWLIQAFELKSVKPIQQTYAHSGDFSHQVDITINADRQSDLISVLELKSEKEKTFTLVRHNAESAENILCSVLCSRCDLTTVFTEINSFKSDIISVDCRELGKVPLPGYGMGRIGSLQSPITLDEAVRLVKKHLNLDHVRMASVSDAGKISKVAVCAGSGASVMRGVKADLLVTGEMSHHEVLNAVSNGSNVILCEHSNTERGYLIVLKHQLKEFLSEEIDVIISQTDSDPLKVV
ncbi:NIF3-like protein 1 [Gigantopelta aegis]|uniref:NIF3-like protein 1 n=1 Tax=Gigantopelta aegis TaxID=1735272 RepID=UPI001B88AAA9|nr:NIF3-like protein 1 [Gigantopelta aegis]